MPAYQQEKGPLQVRGFNVFGVASNQVLGQQGSPSVVSVSSIHCHFIVSMYLGLGMSQRLPANPIALLVSSRVLIMGLLPPRLSLCPLPLPLSPPLVVCGVSMVLADWAPSDITGSTCAPKKTIGSLSP